MDFSTQKTLRNALYSLDATKTLLVGLFLGTILFAWLNFDGYYFYDDYSYMLYAYQLKTGIYQANTTEIFAHRWGIIVPLAVLYTILGQTDIANILLPLTATLASLVLVYKLTLPLPRLAAQTALILAGLDFYTLFFSNKVYPDTLLTPLGLAITYLLWRRKANFWVIFAFVIANAWAFLCKELIIYFVPFYLYLLWVDRQDKQKLLFWAYSFWGACLLALAYGMFYYTHTGDALYRFRLIQEQHYVASYSYFDKPLIYTLQRISYEPFFMFIATTLWITMGGAWVSFFFKPSKDSSFIHFLQKLLASAFLMFWFSSTSLQYYNPIGLFPRHILFLLPLCAIISGYVLSTFQPKAYYLLIVAYLLAAYYAWQSVGIKYSLLYIALAGIFLLGLYWKQIRPYYTDLLLILLALHPLYTVLKPSEMGYKAEKYIMQKYVLPLKISSLIITDNKLFSGYLWYFGFEKSIHLTFQDYKQHPKITPLPQDMPIYFVWNEHSLQYFQLLGQKLPAWVQQIPKSWQKIAQKDGVTLYQKR